MLSHLSSISYLFSSFLRLLLISCTFVVNLVNHVTVFYFLTSSALISSFCSSYSFVSLSCLSGKANGTKEFFLVVFLPISLWYNLLFLPLVIGLKPAYAFTGQLFLLCCKLRTGRIVTHRGSALRYTTCDLRSWTVSLEISCTPPIPRFSLANHRPAAIKSFLGVPLHPRLFLQVLTNKMNT